MQVNASKALQAPFRGRAPAPRELRHTPIVADKQPVSEPAEPPATARVRHAYNPAVSRDIGGWRRPGVAAGRRKLRWAILAPVWSAAPW